MADVLHVTAEQEAKRNQWLVINIKYLPLVTCFNQVGPLSACVCIHMCAGAYALVHVHMNVFAYGGERSASSGFIFLRQDLILQRLPVT